MTGEPILVSFDALNRQVAAIFERAGFSAAQAAASARTIAANERDGCKQVGIYRIDGAIATAREGKADARACPRVTPDDGSAIVRVDAGGGFACLALQMGLPVLVAKARALGLAALVVNDCVHFASLWPEIEFLTDQGLAGLAMCPSYATVAPAGGTMPLLGTNPLAFGWPRPSIDPYVFDFATSAVARGEIELMRRAGKILPAGWAIDRDGAPTTDPAAALQGAMLPFGGHKGSAISTMIELLSGVMIGDATSRQALDELGTTALNPCHGELIIGFDPKRFASGRGLDPLAGAEILLAQILGQGARLPSQRRFDARRTALHEGIPLTQAERDHLDQLQHQEPAQG